MLRAEDNKFLTESGAGTGMGELLRRFWMPVLLSAELPEADGTPKKIMVMGEELLAFRDTRGVVGVIDQYCPHRGANLWLGRNEECGIRCVYHGWKFDTDGACVDMPTSYPDLNAKDLIRIKSYPVREWGDMIWAYMGPADADAGIAGAGNGAGAGLAPLRHQEMAGLQLGAGDGRLDRHRAFHLRASLLRKGRERNPRHQEAFRESAGAGRDRPHALDRRRPAPGDQDQSARGRPDRRRRTAHRHRQHLLAHRPVPDAGACLCAELDAGREYLRPEFYPGDRYRVAGSTPMRGIRSVR